MESISKIFWNQSSSHHCTHRMCIWVMKKSSLQPKSLSLSKHWMLHIAIKSDLERSKPGTQELLGWLVCGKWPGVLERLANLGDHPQTQRGRQKRMPWIPVHLLSLPGQVYVECLEKICREILEPKVEYSQCGFRPNRQHTVVVRLSWTMALMGG